MKNVIESLFAGLLENNNFQSLKIIQETIRIILVLISMKFYL